MKVSAAVVVQITYEPSVWWFDYMGFIKKFIKTRKGKSNLEESQIQIGNDSTSDPTEIRSNSFYNGEETEIEGESVMEFSESELLNNTQITHVPKRKKQNQDKDDHILTSSLHILSNLQKNIESTDVNTMDYARYTARELVTIDDAELVNDAKHDINNILYVYKKKVHTKS